jgi:hypothetical protein
MALNPNVQAQGAPVLFIPGNAGSSHQVRSIASSATRQFYSSPLEVAPDFRSRTLKPLDFFAGVLRSSLLVGTLSYERVWMKDAACLASGRPHDTMLPPFHFQPYSYLL